MALHEFSPAQFILAGAILVTLIALVVGNAWLTKKVRSGTSPIRQFDYFKHWELYLGMLLILVGAFLLLLLLATLAPDGCNRHTEFPEFFRRGCSLIAPLWSK